MTTSREGFSRADGAGGSSQFRVEYSDIAYGYCLLGATNETMGELFGVTTRTIDQWIASHPEFKAAVNAGKKQADARVAKALFSRAVGGVLTKETKVLSFQGKVTDKIEVDTMYPPDVRACQYWLNNRSENWSSKQEVEHSLGDDFGKIMSDAGSDGNSSDTAAEFEESFFGDASDENEATDDLEVNPGRNE